MTQQTVVLVTGALQKSPADCNLVFVMDKWTVASIFLGTLAKLVIEHAILFAASSILHDGVDTSVLGLKYNN